MKNIIIPIALVAVLAMMLFSSCTISVKDLDKAELSGETVKKTRYLGNFNSIESSGGIEIEYLISDSCYIIVEADKALEPKVETEIEDSILHISHKEISFHGEIIGDQDISEDNRTVTIHGIKKAIKRGFSNDIKVYVYAPSLNEVKSSGAIEFNAKKVQSANTLILRTSGASTFDIKEIESRNVAIKTSGAGKINASVSNAEHVELHTSGAGKMNMHFNDCGDVYLKSSGACEAKFTGSVRSISKRTSGAADIDDKNLKVAQESPDKYQTIILK